MVNKVSHFADFVRFCPQTYTRTQPSLAPLWAAIMYYVMVQLVSLFNTDLTNLSFCMIKKEWQNQKVW